MNAEIEHNRGMVFGVFDGLHPGHRFFLTEALRRCRKLSVVVAHDETVTHLKGRPPRLPLQQRIEALRNWNTSLEAVPGDAEHSSWQVLDKCQPDVIFLGYDQQSLVPELKKFSVPIIFLDPHQPEIYKTSLLI